MRPSARQLATLAAAAAPGALTLWLATHAGGFFAGTTALFAVLLAVAVTFRFTMAERPLEALSPALVVAAGALAALAAFALLSGEWSDARARAVLEYDRALLYLLVLLAFGSSLRAARSISAMAAGLLVAIVAIAAAGFASRALPQIWQTDPDLVNNRLSYPLTYWNGLASLIAVGVVLALHRTVTAGDVRIRAGAAAAIPLLAATLVLTYSRAGLAFALAGVVLFALLARPSAIGRTMLGVLPGVSLAVTATVLAGELVGDDPKGSAATAQGARVFAAVVIAMALAAAGRLLVERLPELRAPLVRLPSGAAPRLVAAGAAVLAIAGVAVALSLPAQISDEWHGFVEGERVALGQDTRTRLLEVGGNGRADMWSVALHAFADRPLAGEGAGTFTLRWAEDRPSNTAAQDGHSLYVETLGELGILGLALVLAAIACVLLAFARLRREDRALGAALLAAGAVWTLHAGVDWLWELPAVSLWFFALGGAALAAAGPGGPFSRLVPAQGVRLAVAFAVLATVVLPARMALSQDDVVAGVRALRSGDCAEGVERAGAAARALPLRPEPFELLAYCRLRLGSPDAALVAIDAAIARDPRSWELHYGRAVALGVAGRDPRPTAARALRLNPNEQMIGQLVAALDDSPRRRWPAVARTAPLPVR